MVGSSRPVFFTSAAVKKRKGMKESKHDSTKSLQTLRNIGPATAERLCSIGIKTPDQMRQSDPEKLYEELKRRSGGQLDRCVLYLLQGAILDIPWPLCKNLLPDAK